MRNLILGLVPVSLACGALFYFLASRDHEQTGSDALPMFAAVGVSEEESEPTEWDAEAASFARPLGRKGPEIEPRSFVETIDLAQEAVTSTDDRDDVAVAIPKKKPAGSDNTDRMPVCESWSKAPSHMPYATEGDEREKSPPAVTPPLSRR